MGILDGSSVVSGGCKYLYIAKNMNSDLSYVN